MPQLSFSSINCNSLNITSNSSLQKNLKLYGICKLKTDIIFLSDLRLNTDKGLAKTFDVEKTFTCNPYCSYQFFFNSTRSKRGVGILCKRSNTYVVQETVSDPEGNYLLHRASFNPLRTGGSLPPDPDRPMGQIFAPLAIPIG
jgi:exonuclease III